MGRVIQIYLTNEELKKMRDLCKAYGENSNSRIVKLAIAELHVHCDTLKSHRPVGDEKKVIRIRSIHEKKRILKKEG